MSPIKLPAGLPKNNLMPSSPEDDKPHDRDPIREARLAALRRSISNGTYQIPTGDVADKIIDDILRKG